jgi:hypothetical protein
MYCVHIARDWERSRVREPLINRLPGCDSMIDPKMLVEIVEPHLLLTRIRFRFDYIAATKLISSSDQVQWLPTCPSVQLNA